MIVERSYKALFLNRALLYRSSDFSSDGTMSLQTEKMCYTILCNVRWTVHTKMCYTCAWP
jgi:hypothetical protein